jgi:hypothetical protein
MIAIRVHYAIQRVPAQNVDRINLHRRVGCTAKVSVAWSLSGVLSLSKGLSKRHPSSRPSASQGAWFTDSFAPGPPRRQNCRRPVQVIEFSLMLRKEEPAWPGKSIHW